MEKTNGCSLFDGSELFLLTCKSWEFRLIKDRSISKKVLYYLRWLFLTLEKITVHSSHIVCTAFLILIIITLFVQHLKTELQSSPQFELKSPLKITTRVWTYRQSKSGKHDFQASFSLTHPGSDVTVGHFWNTSARRCLGGIINRYPGGVVSHK